MSLAELSNLLPLPEADLQQVLEYAATLSKQEAANLFNNLLGESAHSTEFIASFNLQRKDSMKPQEPAVPKAARRQPKKQELLRTPPPRKIQDGPANFAQETVYQKKSEDDHSLMAKMSASGGTGVPYSKPASTQAPVRRGSPSTGIFISDFQSKSTARGSSHSARECRSASATTKGKAKVHITGGQSMHGTSTTLSELDAAIRTLEISTNSRLQNNKRHICNCVAARHPLLTVAPNCLACGKVICVKEGLGPCTFCGSPLISAAEVQGMISSLREERGREKMHLDNARHKRAEIAQKPAPFTSLKDVYMTPAELKARQHRDRLLSFQAQNAKRSTVHDEAADFDTDLGYGQGGMWSSPRERAATLKRQQKLLAEQQWNARPEYEKRRQVVSIDVVKGKVLRKMAAIQKPIFLEDDSDKEEEQESSHEEITVNNGCQGTFSRNPLLGGLIKPTWSAGKGKASEGGEMDGNSRKKMWRKVQDNEDNEMIILDGGVLGGGSSFESEDTISA